jgi:uncharacterized protein (TIGR00369 family)
MTDERRYGTCTPEQIAGLSGLELLQQMVAGKLPGPTIAQTLGFTLVEVEAGRAVFEGTPGTHLLNPLGSVHGGWALTLIDSATGCALHTELPAGIGYTTVETKGNFTRTIAADRHRRSADHRPGRQAPRPRHLHPHHPGAARLARRAPRRSRLA